MDYKQKTPEGFEDTKVKKHDEISAITENESINNGAEIAIETSDDEKSRREKAKIELEEMEKLLAVYAKEVEDHTFEHDQALLGLQVFIEHMTKRIAKGTRELLELAERMKTNAAESARRLGECQARIEQLRQDLAEQSTC